MNNEEKLFEFMSQMYADLKASHADLKAGHADLKASQDDLKASHADLKNSQEKMRAEMHESFKTVNGRLDIVENEVKKTNNVIENDIKPKIEALFDGYSLRGDQTERLQNYFDERLNTIQTDLSYVVSKTAQHERKLILLMKADAPRRILQQK